MATQISFDPNKCRNPETVADDSIALGANLGYKDFLAFSPQALDSTCTFNLYSRDECQRAIKALALTKADNMECQSGIVGNAGWEDIGRLFENGELIDLSTESARVVCT